MAIPLSYNLRNLRARWQVTALATIGIALVVAVLVTLTAMAAGFRLALRATGRTDNVMVLQKGADSELVSALTRDAVRALSVDGRVARGTDGQPMASPEILLVAGVRRLADNIEANVALRGVTPRALVVRDGIRLTQGRVFQPGLSEIIVGERVRERYGLEIGKTLTLQRQAWRVVGLFSSDGSAFESEIWGDVDVMGPAFDRADGYQALVLRLRDPGSFDALKATIEGGGRFQATARREREFYDAQAGPTGQMLTTLAWFVAAVMAIGAVSGAMNTMDAVVASRTREIGTLRALGFSRLAILTAFVLESMALSAVGGLIGCLLALPAHGMRGATAPVFSELAFAFQVTPSTLAAGMIFALSIGLVGGLLPALRAARLPIVQALRAA